VPFLWLTTAGTSDQFIFLMSVKIALYTARKL